MLRPRGADSVPFYIEEDSALPSTDIDTLLERFLLIFRLLCLVQVDGVCMAGLPRYLVVMEDAVVGCPVDNFLLTCMGAAPFHYCLVPEHLDFMNILYEWTDAAACMSHEISPSKVPYSAN